MKVTVLGENYTGAHFRMFADPLDGRVCQLTLVGEEQNILAYILENFAWGMPDVDDLEEGDPFQPTIQHLVDEMKKGEGAFGMFDGAGGVFWLKDENGTELVNMLEEYGIEDMEGFEADILNLGEVNVDGVDNMFDHVTHLVSLERDKDPSTWDKTYTDRMNAHMEKLKEQMAQMQAEFKKDENSQG